MAVTDSPRYEEHRFNDDLLTNPGDIGRARRHFPGIIHVLDDPYLRETFSDHDQIANTTKEKSQSRGVEAILMGASAMLIASAIEHPGKWDLRSVGIISFVLGVGSILFGVGVLRGKGKRDQAKIEKVTNKTSQFRGWVAIGLGVVAMVTSILTEIFFRELLLVAWVGIISFFLGVGSIIDGWFGLLHGKGKRDWLCRRVITERLRQFHFQAFCCRWPEIVSSLRSEGAEREYIAQRRAWLDPVKSQLTLHVGAELTELLDDESDAKCWLHPITPTLPPQEGGAELAGSYAELRIRPNPSLLEAEAASTELSAVYRESRMQLAITPDDFAGELDQVFAAYRELRIMHQLHYANYKLHDEYSIFSWPLRMQAVRLSFCLLLCTIAIFFIHCVIAGSVTWYGAVAWQSHSGHTSSLLFLPHLHLVVIWIAIIALAAHALQEGLQPEREIERYRHYRAAARAIRDRFDRASSASAKIEIMREMERLSFDEARNFLRSAHEAQFII